MAKHFSRRHRWQNLRVTTLIVHEWENGQVSVFLESAFRRKNALQLSQVIALKLCPNALSPQIRQIFDESAEVVADDFITACLALLFS